MNSELGKYILEGRAREWQVVKWRRFIFRKVLRSTADTKKSHQLRSTRRGEMYVHDTNLWRCGIGRYALYTPVSIHVKHDEREF